MSVGGVNNYLSSVNPGSSEFPSVEVNKNKQTTNTSETKLNESNPSSDTANTVDENSSLNFFGNAVSKAFDQLGLFGQGLKLFGKLFGKM